MNSGKGGGQAKGIRTEWLEAFLLTAEHQSYSEAARMLDRDQSIVSRHVHHLENWLRTRLLTDEVTLTPNGEEFRPKAVEICRLLRESRVPQPEPRRRTWTRRLPAKDTVSKPAPVQTHPSVSAADIDMSFWTDRPKARSEQSED